MLSTWECRRVDSEHLHELIETLTQRRDTDAPMVEAIGNTLDETARFDSQEQAGPLRAQRVDLSISRQAAGSVARTGCAGSWSRDCREVLTTPFLTVLP